MSSTETRTLLFAAVALGLAALCVLCMRHSLSEDSAKPTKVFARDVAEGMRVWNPKAGVDSIRFASCRVEKMKSGPITFGGLNVLHFKGLVLNLPFTDDEERETGGDAPQEPAESLAGIPKSLLRKASLPTYRVSGIVVDGVTVNKVENRAEVPVFAADELRNRGRTITLANCRVFDGGRTNFVGKATLRMTPAPVLAWHGGERRLDDLFPNAIFQKGTKQ